MLSNDDCTRSKAVRTKGIESSQGCVLKQMNGGRSQGHKIQIRTESNYFSYLITKYGY